MITTHFSVDTLLFYLFTEGDIILNTDKGRRQIKKYKNKLGLSWAKLSGQLGFGCIVTIPIEWANFAP